MKLVEFYRGEIPNNEGVFLEEILSYSYGQFEVDHAYIQWILPLKERSMFNTDAPLLHDDEIALFKSDPALRSKLSEVVQRMLDYFGMYFHRGVVNWQEPDPEHGHKDPKWWLRHFNHNFLRMTRMLTSLRYLGLEDISVAIYNCLLSCRDMYGKESYEYWTDAATGPLL